MTTDPKHKSNIFGLVINGQKENSNPCEELEQIQKKLLEQFPFVATIIHDKDITDNGETKRTHLHAYIELPQKSTIKGLLEELTNLLGIRAEQISIDPTNNEYLLIQYLTHKNQPSKTQYNFENIKTNDTEKLGFFYNKTYTSKEEEERLIQSSVINSKSFIELVQKIGLNNANKFRATYNQVKQEQHEDLENLIKQNQRFEIIFTKILEIVNEVYFTNQENELRKAILELFENYEIIR